MNKYKCAHRHAPWAPYAYQRRLWALYFTCCTLYAIPEAAIGSALDREESDETHSHGPGTKYQVRSLKCQGGALDREDDVPGDSGRQRLPITGRHTVWLLSNYRKKAAIFC